jgi:hypothetical protein
MSDMTKEEAVKFIAALAESIRPTLRTIVQVADEHDIDVKLLDDFGNYLRYYGRPYIDEYCEIRDEDGGWYSSHC